jgi:hypothetical protein
VKHCATTWQAIHAVPSAFDAQQAAPDEPYLSHRWLTIIGAAERHISAEKKTIVRTMRLQDQRRLRRYVTYQEYTQRRPAA